MKKKNSTGVLISKSELISLLTSSKTKAANQFLKSSFCSEEFDKQNIPPQN